MSLALAVLEIDSPPCAVTRLALETAQSWARWFFEQTGLPWGCYDVSTGKELAISDPSHLVCCPLGLCESLTEITRLSVKEPEPGFVCVALPAPASTDAELILISTFRARPDARPMELQFLLEQRQWTGRQQEQFWQTAPVCSPSVAEHLISAVLAKLDATQHETRLKHAINVLTPKIDQASHEISLLHSLSQHLQVSRSPRDIAAMCLDQLQALTGAAGHVIIIEDHERHGHFLTMGKLPLDQEGLARLVARFDNHDWLQPVIRSHVQRTLLGADFPGLRNFILAPIGAGPRRLGWLFACNREEAEFGPSEATLFNTVAGILATHLKNTALFHEHDELVVGFIRSLVSTLDAKDPYTRGHSERVALIARRLGQQLRLPQDDLDDIYLSSLLHDIGKIGIDDRVLRKPDRLTDDEMRHIQQHPLIGYQILSPLKTLHHILPGVRSHHEAYNGTGYPDGLRGNEIPLMARIIAVADSYDAIGSNRPYRPGMPLDELEALFHEGSGTQWDPAIIDAYFAARRDVSRICADYFPTAMMFESDHVERSLGQASKARLRY